MNPFQKLLNEFIDAKDMTIYALAKISGVERSFVQKMKNGSRIPADENVVHTLAQALMLTPSETMELLKAYRITKMGEENYYRREQVKNTITSFCDTQISSQLITNNITTQALELKENHEFVEGMANINKLVKAVLELEAQKEKGCVKIIAQPCYKFLYDCISTLDFNSKQTKIENIIVFDKQESFKSQHHNLAIFQQLVSSLFSCDNFQPYYIRDYVDTIFNDTSFLPYVIITSDYCLRIAFDLNSAIISSEPKLLQLANRQFEKRLAIASAIYRFFRPAPHEYLQATAVETAGELGNSDHFNIFFQPNLNAFIPVDIMLDRVNKDIITPEMQQFLVQYYQSIGNHTVNVHIAFTMEGIELFMETGRITEIPDFMYSYLKPQQRLRVLKNLIAGIDRGHFMPRILKSTSFNLAMPISITATSPQKVLIYYITKEKGLSIFFLNELNLINAFYDFLVYVQDSELVYTQSETKNILEKMLNNYQERFAREFAESTNLESTPNTLFKGEAVPPPMNNSPKQIILYAANPHIFRSKARIA